MLKLSNNTGQELSQDSLANPRKYRKEIDIADLLCWTYQDQCADEVARKSDHGLYPAAVRSNLLTIERNGRLGTQIDCSGSSGAAGADIHPDAEAVHDAVRTLKPLWIGLLIDYGKTGEHQEYLPGVIPRPAPMMNKKGKPKLEYRDKAKTKPIYCLIQYVPEQSTIDFVRSVYEEWWLAMSTLAEKLSDLTDHIVTGPSAPRRPWLNLTVDSADKN